MITEAHPNEFSFGLFRHSTLLARNLMILRMPDGCHRNYDGRLICYLILRVHPHFPDGKMSVSVFLYDEASSILAYPR
jgi:hypothetical protein